MTSKVDHRNVRANSIWEMPIDENNHSRHLNMEITSLKELTKTFRPVMIEGSPFVYVKNISAFKG